MILLMTLLLQSSVSFAAPVQPFLADLELFRQRSVTIRTEKEKLDADRVVSLSRLLQLTPSVSAGVGKTETRTNSDLTGGKSKAIYDYWRLSADWNLFKGFSDYHAWRAAEHEKSAQGFQVRAEELRTELDGSKVIFNRLYLRDVRQAQEELLKLKQETMRIGRDRYRAGKIPLQDVTRMEVDLSQQQNVVRQSEIDFAQNEAAYKAFFVDELQTQDWPLTETQSLALAEGEGSFASKRLKEQALSFENSWKSARDQHLPRLDFALTYKELPLRSPNTGTWSGTLELSIPLWSRFELAAASAQGYSRYVEAEGLSSIAEREEALRRDFVKKKIKLSFENIKESRLNQEKSDRLYRDMLRSFQLGRLATNDLFIEQNRKIESLLLFTRSRLSFHESLMEACALWGLRAKSCLR
jgi:outer membrane protein TolC